MRSGVVCLVKSYLARHDRGGRVATRGVGSIGLFTRLFVGTFVCVSMCVLRMLFVKNDFIGSLDGAGGFYTLLN